MDEKRGGSADPDGVREWLLQLERRVAELEREHALAMRRRRRGLWYIAVMVILYLGLTYYVTNLTGL